MSITTVPVGDGRDAPVLCFVGVGIRASEFNRRDSFVAFKISSTVIRESERAAVEIPRRHRPQAPRRQGKGQQVDASRVPPPVTRRAMAAGTAEAARLAARTAADTPAGAHVRPPGTPRRAGPAGNRAGGTLLRPSPEPMTTRASIPGTAITISTPARLSGETLCVTPITLLVATSSLRSSQNARGPSVSNGAGENSTLGVE